MLLLSRREGESVVLLLPDGREVWLTLVAVRDCRGQVRLGVTAPRDVPIWRAEIRPQEAEP